MITKEDVALLTDQVMRLYADNRRLDAYEVAKRLALELSGDAVLELRSWPICVKCGGTGETSHPDEAVRKVRCQDRPEVCVGNRYGRMSPQQLSDYMAQHAGVVEPLPPAIHDSLDGPPPVDVDLPSPVDVAEE